MPTIEFLPGGVHARLQRAMQWVPRRGMRLPDDLPGWCSSQATGGLTPPSGRKPAWYLGRGKNQRQRLIKPLTPHHRRLFGCFVLTRCCSRSCWVHPAPACSRKPDVASTTMRAAWSVFDARHVVSYRNSVCSLAPARMSQTPALRGERAAATHQWPCLDTMTFTAC